jgi:hypothetical protein
VAYPHPGIEVFHAMALLSRLTTVHALVTPLSVDFG